MNKEYKRLKDTYIPNIPYSEKLSEKEIELDSLLDNIKKQADVLYFDNDPYGIIEWDDKEDIHPQLYKFCHDLPKGGDLHAHDNTMISYDRLWQTMKQKGITQYTLIKKYNISPAQITRLKRNESVSTHTIEMFCKILKCDVEDIMQYIDDENI